MQWINWLGGRWRTQLNARHNVNCRTHEHRHFERILQVCTCYTPTLVSGSVIQHPWGDEFALSPLLSGKPRCFWIKSRLEGVWLANRLLGSTTRVGQRTVPLWVRARGDPTLSPTFLTFRPDIKGDYPPNLSILISGGKENNCDSLSNGEWNGNRASRNCRSSWPRGMSRSGESSRGPDGQSKSNLTVATAHRGW